MIYVENDFYSNFQGAVNSSDEVTLKDMIIDQLSTLIAKNRGEVLELFQKSGVKTSPNPSNEEIVNLIIQNIKNNIKLRAGLSFLIAKKNELLATSVKTTRSEGEKKEKNNSDKIDYEKSADTVTYIANSFNTLVQDLKGEKLTKFQQKLQKQTNAKAPNFSIQAYSKVEGSEQTQTPKKKSKKWMWILLGVAVAGGVYYAYKKGMFKKAETGGIVEP